MACPLRLWGGFGKKKKKRMYVWWGGGRGNTLNKRELKIGNNRKLVIWLWKRYRPDRTPLRRSDSSCSCLNLRLVSRFSSSPSALNHEVTSLGWSLARTIQMDLVFLPFCSSIFCMRCSACPGIDLCYWTSQITFQLASVFQLNHNPEKVPETSNLGHCKYSGYMVHYFMV